MGKTKKSTILGGRGEVCHCGMNSITSLNSVFDYLSIIWCKTSVTKLQELDVLYKKVAKIALDYDRTENSIKVYCDMKWLPLHLRRQLHLSNYMFKIITGTAPPHLMDNFSYVSGGSRNSAKCNLYIKKSRSHKQFYYLGASVWNQLPQTLRESEDCKKFSLSYKNLLLDAIKSDPLYTVNNRFDVFYILPSNN